MQTAPLGHKAHRIHPCTNAGGPLPAPQSSAPKSQRPILEESPRGKRCRFSNSVSAPYTSWERAENECHNDLFRAFVPKGTSMEGYSAKDILRVADELNVDSGKSWAMQPRRICSTPSLTGCTRQIATLPVKPSRKRLRLACGILGSSSRSCCEVAKSGFRRTILIHAGVQLALSICASEGKSRSSQLF